KKNDVERVILAPDSIARSSDSPMLSTTKETESKQTIPNKETATSAQPQQNNDLDAEQQEQSPVVEEVEASIKTATDKVKEKALEVEDGKTLEDQKSATTESTSVKEDVI